jgi:hypothetical protein
MARNLFSQLKRYSGGIISQDENYATEALATLLDEFPSFRMFLIRELFNIETEPEAIVRTQVSYDTKRFGRAILDLVIEDNSYFITVEVKVESGLNIYESNEEVEQETYNQTYDQIAKYEDCQGFPDKSPSIFTLSKYPLPLKSSSYKYFKPEANQKLWRDLYAVTYKYYCSLETLTPEKYLLGKFTDYLKEEGMAGFQGFKIDHLANLSRRAETDDICSDFRALILQNISIAGFKGRDQTAHDRDGILYTPENKKDLPYVGIFVGLWLSDEQTYLKFSRETGPQVQVTVGTEPRGQFREKLLSSQAYERVSGEFRRQSPGWRILLRHRPLVDFIGSNEQAGSLLEFYRESIRDLEESGLLDEIRQYLGEAKGRI